MSLGAFLPIAAANLKSIKLESQLQLLAIVIRLRFCHIHKRKFFQKNE